jgi:hypothetical protein
MTMMANMISEFVRSYWEKAGNLCVRIDYLLERSEARPPECEEAGVTTSKIVSLIFS